MQIADHYNLEDYCINNLTRICNGQFSSELEFSIVLTWRCYSTARIDINHAIDVNKFKSLAELVERLNYDLIRVRKSGESLLNVLMSKYKFTVELSTAILFVLFPTRFIPYDRRCSIVTNYEMPYVSKKSGMDELSNNEIWNYYQEYIRECKSATESIEVEKNLINRYKMLLGTYNLYKVNSLMKEVNGVL